MPKSAPQVVVVGLDGATFDQIQPMVEEGKLPSFARLLEEGTWGKLESTIPPTTPPAWSTMLTGVNPGKHGIFDFRLTPHANPDRPFIDLGRMKSIKVWEALDRLGKTSGFLNVPVMYPPAPIRGWMVSGMMAPSVESAFTFPDDLRAELLTAFPDYVTDVDIPRYDNTFWEDMALFLDDLEHCTRRHIDAFFHLWDNRTTDFLMGVFVATDRIGHLLWKFTDKRYPQYNTALGQKVRERVAKIYDTLDVLLAETIERVAQNGGLLLVMSDHGFGGMDGYFHANRLLESMGLLRIKHDMALQKKMFYRAWKLGDSRFVKSVLPKKFQRNLRNKIRKNRSSFVNDVEPLLDLNGTSVFYASIPCHGYFIRRKGAGAIVTDDAKAAELRERIKRALDDLKHPDGNKLVTAIWDREALYSGPMVQHAPDIVFSVRDFSVVPQPYLGATDLFRSAADQPNGFHRLDGVFMLWGEHVEALKIEGAKMVDIAPTIIDRMNLPMPPMVEGRSLLKPDITGGRKSIPPP